MCELLISAAITEHRTSGRVSLTIRITVPRTVLETNIKGVRHSLSSASFSEMESSPGPHESHLVHEKLKKEPGVTTIMVFLLTPF